MASFKRTVSVGAPSKRVDLELSESAIAMLDQLPSARPDGSMRDHRPLLTSIAISRAAAGDLVGHTLQLDAEDIPLKSREPDMTDIAASPYRR